MTTEPGTTESAPETRNILRRTVPRRVVFALVIALPMVGFLLGSIGTLGGDGSTTTVKATVTPQAIGLKPGSTGSVTILVKNPGGDGARVSNIGAGQSDAVKDCAAGSLTSEELSNPAGYIPPNDVNAYAITVTLKDNAPQGCLKQELTLPLTVELASARS